MPQLCWQVLHIALNLQSHFSFELHWTPNVELCMLYPSSFLLLSKIEQQTMTNNKAGMIDKIKNNTSILISFQNGLPKYGAYYQDNTRVELVHRKLPTTSPIKLANISALKSTIYSTMQLPFSSDTV